MRILNVSRPVIEGATTVTPASCAPEMVRFKVSVPAPRFRVSATEYVESVVAASLLLKTREPLTVSLFAVPFRVSTLVVSVPTVCSQALDL